jgi:hypothetical protein
LEIFSKIQKSCKFLKILKILKSPKKRDENPQKFSKIQKNLKIPKNPQESQFFQCFGGTLFKNFFPQHLKISENSKFIPENRKNSPKTLN